MPPTELRPSSARAAVGGSPGPPGPGPSRRTRYRKKFNPPPDVPETGGGRLRPRRLALAGVSSRWASSRRRTCIEAGESRACNPSSRRRARAEVFITDLGSARGAGLVNGHGIKAKTRLSPATGCLFANTRVVVRVGEAQAAAPARRPVGGVEKRGTVMGMQSRCGSPPGGGSPAGPPLRGRRRRWSPPVAAAVPPPPTGGCVAAPPSCGRCRAAPATCPRCCVARPSNSSAVEVRAKPFAAGLRLRNTDIFFQAPQARPSIKKTIPPFYLY